MASIWASGATIALAVGGLAGLTCWVKAREGFQDIKKPALILLSFYLLLLATDFLNGGVWENIQRTGANYLPLLVAVPFAMGLRAHQSTDLALLITVGLTILGATGWAIWQAVGLGIPRVEGFQIGSAIFGFIVVTWGLFLLANCLYGNVGRLPSLILAFVAFVPIILTGSKTIMLAAFLSYGVLLMRKAVIDGQYKLLVAGVVALSCLMVMSFIFLDSTGRIDQLRIEGLALLESRSTDGSTLGPRIKMWAAGVQAFFERPIVGHGFSNVISEAARFEGDTGGLPLSMFNHLHNDYITHMVAYGAMGLVFLIAFMTFVIWLSQRQVDPVLKAFGIAWTVLLAVQMFADLAFNLGPMTGLMGLILALLLAGLPKLDAKR